MSGLDGFVHSAAAGALGWALAHFLWEGALLAALLAALMFVARPASSRVRYALACLTLLAMPVAFGVTLVLLWPSETTVTVPHGQLAIAAAAGAAAVKNVAAPDRLPWLVPLWMCGVIAFYVRTAGGWLAVQRLRRRAAVRPETEWQGRVRALAARLGISRAVTLLESHVAETPFVVGLWRPVILAPVGLLTGLTPDHLEAILLHELAHIRRWDYAVNVAQTLVEGLLFYHPAVWWTSSVVRAEREHCCDDMVVAVRGDARGYAEALTALEATRRVAEPALAARGGNLMKRIRRILEPPRPRSTAGAAALAAALLTVAAVGLSAWQPGSAPDAAAASRLPAAAAQAALLHAQTMSDAEQGAARVQASLAVEKERQLAAEEKAALLHAQTMSDAAQDAARVQASLAAEKRVQAYTEERRIRQLQAEMPELEAEAAADADHRSVALDSRIRSLMAELAAMQKQGSSATRPEVVQLEAALRRAAALAQASGPQGTPDAALPQVRGLFVNVTQTPSGKGTTRNVTVGLSGNSQGKRLNVMVRVTTLANKRVSTSEDTVTGASFSTTYPIEPGSYHLSIALTDPSTNETWTYERTLEVKAN